MKLYQKLTLRQWIILALICITAIVHLFLGGIQFKLNGLGYFGLLALYFIDFKFIPIPRALIRWVLVGYAGLTIILYIVIQIQSGGEYVSALGIFTKVVELVLIYLLASDRV